MKKQLILKKRVKVKTKLNRTKGTEYNHKVIVILIEANIQNPIKMMALPRIYNSMRKQKKMKMLFK